MKVVVKYILSIYTFQTCLFLILCCFERLQQFSEEVPNNLVFISYQL